MEISEIPVSYIMRFFLTMGSLTSEQIMGCVTLQGPGFRDGWVLKKNKRVVSIPAQLLKAVVSGT